MKAKAKKPSRLAKALLKTAKDMRRAGVLDVRAFGKITLRHLGDESILSMRRNALRGGLPRKATDSRPL